MLRILIVVGLFGLAACNKTTPSLTDGLVLNRGNGAEPESLDMHKSSSTEALDVLLDLGEGLTGFTPDGALRPAAATRWTISADGLEYQFWLQPNARWSNGDPLTAVDFVYSFRRLVDPATAALNVGSVADIANAEQIIARELPTSALGVEAIGEHQLKIQLQQPVPYFLMLLTHPSTFPVHRGSIEQHGDAHARPGNLVSNGAYILRDWQVGSFIELSRNENYWNDAETSIDRVRYYVTPQPMPELNRFRAGELDTTRTIPPEAFAQMQEERPSEVRTSPSLGVYYYGFNLSKPMFADNPKLRQALSMALDREVIAFDVLGRGEPPAYGWVPIGIAGYEPRKFSYASMSKAERHLLAQQLYREAGFGPDRHPSIELRYNTSATHKSIAVAAQSMWRENLGLVVKLINEDFQVLLDNVRQKEVTQMFRLGWTGNYNDPHTFLTTLESDNPSNLTGYSSEQFDALMQQAAKQTDPERRMQLLGEAESVMLTDHPLIPLYFNVNRSMVSNRVKGWGDNVLNYHYSQHLRLVAEE